MGICYVRITGLSLGWNVWTVYIWYFWKTTWYDCSDQWPTQLKPNRCFSLIDKTFDVEFPTASNLSDNFPRLILCQSQKRLYRANETYKHHANRWVYIHHSYNSNPHANQSYPKIHAPFSPKIDLYLSFSFSFLIQMFGWNCRQKHYSIHIPMCRTCSLKLK